MYKDSNCRLFIIAKDWKQPKCASVADWLLQVWYVCTIAYMQFVTKNEEYLYTVGWSSRYIKWKGQDGTKTIVNHCWYKKVGAMNTATISSCLQLKNIT